MKLKKVFPLLPVAALLLALLSACGPEQGSASSQPPSAAPSGSISAAPELSATPDINPDNGASITTNGGEVIALSALAHQSETGSTVYYISDIIPEAMVAVYEALFTESMAEAGKSVSDYLGNGEHIVYINVMNLISIDCDCGGNPQEPDIHDIGVLASADPVALDQVCIDIVSTAQGNESLMQRIERHQGIHTLEHAEEIGLGSRNYVLVDIGE